MSGMEGMTERTDEQVVKEKRPDAWADPYTWDIWSAPWTDRESVSRSKWLGHGITERAAWHDAAERIRKEQL